MKKITIPQSTYGKTAKYISSSTLRFTVTMDEQTYLKLLRLAESGNPSRNRRAVSASVSGEKYRTG